MLQARYRKHGDKLFVFLERADVPCDNNGSERGLRNSVIHRKVTGEFRSDSAPGAYATITTVVETAKKRGNGVLEALLVGVGRSLPVEITPSKVHELEYLNSYQMVYHALHHTHPKYQYLLHGMIRSGWY